MNTAEKAHQRVLAFLQFWGMGSLLLFVLGIVCSTVTAILRIEVLNYAIPDRTIAILAAVLFELVRLALLIVGSLASYTKLEWPSNIRAFARFIAAAASTLSCAMNCAWLMEQRPGWGADDLVSLTLVVLLELSIWALFSLSMAINGAKLRAIFARKNLEDEAVIGYIYEVRAQQIASGKLEFGKQSIVERAKELGARTRSEFL